MPRDDGKRVEKKQSIAAMFAGRGQGLRRPEARGSGPPNRHGLPKLPVGQHEVKHWPRLDLGVIPLLDRASWRLELDGLVLRPGTYDFARLLALPQTTEVADFHCVTTWSRMDMAFTGVRFADLAADAGVRPEARFVLCEGYDRAPGTDVPYTTNLPLASALEPDVLIVHTVDGAPLEPEHGGPVRMVTPRLYAWKGAKWLRRITFLAEDRPGFWEQRGYSNTADPWLDDRFTGGTPPTTWSAE